MTLRRLVRGTLIKLIWFGLLIWLLIRLAPSLKEVSPIRLAQGMATSVELHQIHTALQGHRTLNSGYPRDFKKFMLRSFTSELKDVTLDSWGTPYRYDQRGRGYEIRSAGPDKLFGSHDDYYLVHQDPGGAQSGWPGEFAWRHIRRQALTCCHCFRGCSQSHFIFLNRASIIPPSVSMITQIIM